MFFDIDMINFLSSADFIEVKSVYTAQNAIKLAKSYENESKPSLTANCISVRQIGVLSFKFRTGVSS